MKTLRIPAQDIHALAFALLRAQGDAENIAALWFEDSLTKRPSAVSMFRDSLECMRVAYETREQLLWIKH